MAERHTVDVDVVGSKPIRLPKTNRPRFSAGGFDFQNELFAMPVSHFSGWLD